MAMFAVLERMFGDAPERERRNSPTPGYATFDNVLTAIGQQTEAFTRALSELREDFRAENRNTRSLIDTYRAETNQRLSELEQWRETQEDAALIRQGKTAVTLGMVRILAKHWQLVWALVALVLGIVAMLSGGPVVSVGPQP